MIAASPMTTGRHVAVTSGRASALAVISGPTPAGSPMVMPSTGSLGAIRRFLRRRAVKRSGAPNPPALLSQRDRARGARDELAEAEAARGGAGELEAIGAERAHERVRGVAAADREQLRARLLEQARGGGGERRRHAAPGRRSRRVAVGRREEDGTALAELGGQGARVGLAAARRRPLPRRPRPRARESGRASRDAGCRRR